MPKSKKAAAVATFTVTQVRSEAGVLPKQKLALKGLGLRRIGTVRELQDTPAIRGMVRQVQHLVTVSE